MIVCPVITDAQAEDHNRGYSLHQNYPDPFRDTTTIKFSLKEDCYVKLYVTEQSTGKIYSLVDGEMTKGDHGIIFKAAELNRGVSVSYCNFKCTFETYSLNSNTLVYTSEIKMTQK